MTREFGIAVNRFALGATPETVVATDPRGWLTAQLDRYRPTPAEIAKAPPPQHVIDAMMAYKATPGKPERMEARRAFARGVREGYKAEVHARMATTLVSEEGFAERIVAFWSNHFAVSAHKIDVRAFAGRFEFDAIRPNVMGSFRALLMAAERHPAMLMYLDQAGSVGPDSALARRRGGGKLGLNENLAREILELHTLGVRSGYTQADVTEFARALTGWTAGGVTRFARDEPAGRFAFLPDLHEPGARTILGKRYPEGGEGQGAAVLADLARHPATVTHVATKLARHFAGNPAPPTMVARLAAAFMKSDGDLPTVYRAIIASPEAWVERPVRFRTPWEWAIASLRTLGIRSLEGDGAVGLMEQLGQPVWTPGQPAGWDDDDATWAGPDAVMRRVEAAERFAGRSDAPQDARALAAKLYPAMSLASTAAIARAESPAQALALLLVSPEAMRR